MYETTRRRLVCALAVMLIALITVCACLQVEVNTGSTLHGGAAVHDMAAWHARWDSGITALANRLPPRLGALVHLFRTEAAVLSQWLLSR